MSRTADISFSDEATEPAEQFFVMLIGYDMIVIPEVTTEIPPFTAELVSIGVGEGDGQLKGVWRPVDQVGKPIDSADPIMLDLYDELDRVEVL